MWQDLFTTVQGWMTLVLVFALGGWLVANGRLDFAQLMIIPSLAGAIGTAMSQIGATYAGLQPPVVAARRLFDIIDSVPQSRGPAKTAPAWDGKYDINLNQLNFAYKGAEENALTDIDLTIKENTMVAFVGESGSGKSTLLRAIIGMYEREGMGMELGSQPFSPEHIQDWRSRFAYVDQSCKLFDMTVSENISMGDPTNPATCL